MVIWLYIIFLNLYWQEKLILQAINCDLKASNLCKICNTGQVEDEIHFVTQCTAYTKHREVLLSEMNLTNYNESPEEKFIKIMKTSKDTDLIALGRYILACLQLRKNSNQS